MNLTEDGAYWIMDWKGNANKPSHEVIFEPEIALATLLKEGVVFLNTHWWESTWPEAAKNSICVAVTVSDYFLPRADAEELLFEEIQELYDHWAKDKATGVIVWAAKKRGVLPMHAEYTAILAKKVWTPSDFKKVQD